MTTIQTVGVRDRANVTDTQTRADSKADKKAAKLAAAKAAAAERQRVSDAKLVKSKADKAKLVEELASDGKAIKALCASMAEQEKKVEEDLASNTHAKKVFEYKLGIAKRLDDAKVKCKKANVSFEEFRAEHAPDFGKTKIYQLLQVARGEITFDEIKLLATARKQKSRSTTTTTLHGDGTVSQEPRATGNSGVAEPEPGDVRKAELGNKEARERLVKAGWKQSEVDGNSVFTPPTQTAEPDETFEGPPTQPETAEQISFTHLEALRSFIGTLDLTPDDALSALKAMADYVMPRLPDNEASDARKYVSNMPMWEKARAKLQAAEKKAA